MLGQRLRTLGRVIHSTAAFQNAGQVALRQGLTISRLAQASPVRQLSQTQVSNKSIQATADLQEPADHTEPEAKSPRYKWTSEQDKRLLQLVEERGTDWDALANEFPNLLGPALRGRHRYLTTRVKAWESVELARLKEALAKFGPRKRWVKIAEAVETRTPQQCYTRWYSVPLEGEKAGQWPIEQDMALLLIIYDGAPGLLQHTTEFQDLCRQYRSFTPAPYCEPWPRTTSESTDTDPPTGLVAVADPSVDPEPMLWHKVAHLLGRRKLRTYHPHYVRRRWRRLQRAAGQMARLPKRTVDRLFDLSRQKKRLDVKTAKEMGASVTASEIPSLLRVLALTRYMEHIIQAAAAGKYKKRGSKIARALKAKAPKPEL
ncbi:Myb- protein A [Tieghemiomyces parasiticus]|uniref:Myb- protein A n=1 Tax=Tieghemiomyces parasiticus TaxID=78921 RepID=A0A9W8DM82_9FUNG|nr:Myb- protein A [Tieghemiomyces parasiticus]